MKKILTIVCAAVMAVFAGCKTVPSTSTVYALSEAVGVAAGKACELAMADKHFDDNARTTTLAILNVLEETIPNTNETFTATWTPVVNELTAKFVAEGKIDATQGELIKLAMGMVTQALDYEFDVRHLKWKQYQDIVSAAVHGFAAGYTYVIKPVNPTRMAVPLTEREYDVETFNFLKAKFKL